MDMNTVAGQANAPSTTAKAAEPNVVNQQKPEQTNTNQEPDNVGEQVNNANADVNTRLLEESKSYKARAKAAEDELAKIKSTALKEQGKFKELYEEAQTKFEALKKTVMQNKVESSVMTIAAKAGCLETDATALLALGNTSLLQFDEETATVYGAEEFIENVKKTRPYLFSKIQGTGINTTIPGGQLKPEPVDLRKVVKNDDTFKQALAGAFNKK